MPTTSDVLASPAAWSVTGLARQWRVSPRQVYAAIHEGRLRAFKVGKHFRITDESRRAFEDSAADAA